MSLSLLLVAATVGAFAAADVSHVLLNRQAHEVNGLAQEGQFWWMDKESPLAQAASDFRSTRTAPEKLDLSQNPFFNGGRVSSDAVHAGDGQVIRDTSNGFIGVQPHGNFLNVNRPRDAGRVECSGQGRICVKKHDCVNGIIQNDGFALIPVGNSVAYCNPNTEVCCRYKDVDAVSPGKSSVYKNPFLNEPKLSITNLGETGADINKLGSTTLKPTRDAPFSGSTIDYSNAQFSDDVRFGSTFRGPAYIPPAVPTPRPPPVTRPPPPPSCPPGQQRVNGVCQLPACPPGQQRVNGQCRSPPPPPPTQPPQCPPGQQRVNGICQLPPCPPGQFRVGGGQCQSPPTPPPVPQCPPGQQRINGVCQLPACPPGQTRINGQCRSPPPPPPPPTQPPQCPPGQQRVNGVCQLPACPPGQFRVGGGQCQSPPTPPPVPQCPPGQQRVNGVCQQPACPPGQYRVNGVCQRPTPPPVTQPPAYLPPEETKCNKDEISQNNQCVKITCPPGYRRGPGGDCQAPPPPPPQCPPGYRRGPNGVCQPTPPPPPPPTQPPQCPPGYRRGPNGVCQPPPPPPTQPPQCPPGYRRGPNGVCQSPPPPPPPPTQPPQCPPGYRRGPNGVCQPPPPPPTQPPQCPPGYRRGPNGVCQPPPPPPPPPTQPPQCPPGYRRGPNGVCQPPPPPPPTQPPQCPPGYRRGPNGVCQPPPPPPPPPTQPPQCPPGYRRGPNGVCQPPPPTQPPQCPPGYRRGPNGVCQPPPTPPPPTNPPTYLPPTCNYNEILQNGICVPKPPICSGDTELVNGRCVPRGYQYPRPTPPFNTGNSPDGTDTQEIFIRTSTTTQRPDNSGQPDTPQQTFVRPPGGDEAPIVVECAAALKCIKDIYCTAEGFISPVPVSIAADIPKVPLSNCTEPETGDLGVCCRDPDYKDPWPSANLVNGIDNGQYREDPSLGQYTPVGQRLVRSNQRERATNQQPTCGRRHLNTQPKGPGQFDAHFAEIPWQAMILREANRSLLCGGAIIGRNAILTSAHCVEGLQASDVLIKGGEWKLGIDEEPLPFQIVKVQQIHLHPNYDNQNLHNDLAVLVLEEKLRFTKNIGSICLPKVNEQPAGKCITTGWGKKVLQVHLKGAIMRLVDVQPVDKEECSNHLQNNFPDVAARLGTSSFCTQASGDQCKVDHGSAMACTTDDLHYTLHGIFSWDTGCKDDKQVGAYILPDVEWIESVIGRQ